MTTLYFSGFEFRSDPERFNIWETLIKIANIPNYY